MSTHRGLFDANWLYCIAIYANISWKHSQRLMTTSINERTHFFTKIYLSHFILDVSVVCEMSGDRDRLLYWSNFFSWPEQHLFRILAGLLYRGSLRATALNLQAGPHSGIPVSDWVDLPIFFPNVHLLPHFIRLFILVNLSVEGQYIRVTELY